MREQVILKIVFSLIPRLAILLVYADYLAELTVRFIYFEINPAVSEGSLLLSIIAVSIILLLHSLVTLSPISYSLTAVVASILIPELGLISSPLTIVILIYLMIATTFRTTYRVGQAGYIYVQNKKSLLISAVGVFLVSAAIAAGVAFFASTLINSIRVVQVSTTSLIPLALFLSQNPVGISLVLVPILAAIYILLNSSISTLILYVSPSRNVAVKELSEFVQEDHWVKPPLMFIRRTLLTLLIAPLIYSLINGLFTIYPEPIERFREAVTYINPDLGSYTDWIISLAIFIATWSIVALSIDISTPSIGLRNIAASTAAIAMLYLAAYLVLLPIAGFEPGLEGFDRYLSSTIYTYYTELFSILELIPILGGLVP